VEIKDLEEKYPGFLKKKPSGDEAVGWIAVRTALELCFPKASSLSGRVRPILDRVLPELNGTLLDVGCYGGWLYPLVREKVTYTGIDVYPEAVKVAQTLFGERFKVCSFSDYNEQHDIVWATQLHPEVSVPKHFQKLKSLSRKMLILTYQSTEIVPGGEEFSINNLTASIYRW